MLRIVHVIAGLDATHGGPSYSVPRLCRALAGFGNGISLLSIQGSDPWRDGRPICEYRECRFPQDYAKLPVLRRLRCSSALRGALNEEARWVDVIHNHGLWLMPNVEVGWAAKRAGKPLVVSPRGMLAGAALAFSKKKKRLFWFLLQGPAIRDAACLHATSEAEYEEIRAYGLVNPVAIVPNGIDLPELPPVKNAAVGADRVVLSLGRIHPKKGLDRLLRAWKNVEPRHPEWRLKIAGPNEGVYAGQLRALACSLGLTRLSIEGPVYGEAKWDAYRSAELFVLPTLNENFGLTVGEALASGTPSIATKGAPWSGMEREGCGWWIDDGADTLAATLSHAMELPPKTLRIMGAKGRAWMARDFSWDRVAREIADVYQWIAYGGDPPTVVRMD